MGLQQQQQSEVQVQQVERCASSCTSPRSEPCAFTSAFTSAGTCSNACARKLRRLDGGADLCRWQRGQLWRQELHRIGHPHSLRWRQLEPGSHPQFVENRGRMQRLSSPCAGSRARSSSQPRTCACACA